MEDEENQGNMLIGVLLGFFLQCLGIIVAFAMGGQKTLTGSIIGTVLAVLGWTCMFGGLGLLSFFLNM